MLISRRFERKIMDKYITMPITEETTAELKAGDYVYLTGTMYVARDAAHKRMIEALDEGGELPIDIRDATIYYMGPSPAREGRPIGSAGPTTATRMDKYAPRLLDLGEKAMIGKGKRSKEVVDAVVRNHAVYFAAIGGAGALLSKCITKSEIVCYEDLGAEAIRKIEVKDFPVIVVIDREGNNLYETAIQQYHTLEEMKRVIFLQQKRAFRLFFLPVLFQNKQQRHFETSLCGYAVQTVLLKTKALACV